MKKLECSKEYFLEVSPNQDENTHLTWFGHLLFAVPSFRFSDSVCVCLFVLYNKNTMNVAIDEKERKKTLLNKSSKRKSVFARK